MKSKWLVLILVVLLAMLTTSQLAAQESASGAQHHHYKLVDLGTLGGPSTYFNSLDMTDVFGFSTVFYNMAQVRNSRGVFVGFSETSTPDPYPGFCYVPDCFVTHAFEWSNGVKKDLGTLPNGASSAPFWINAKGWITGNSQNGEVDPLIPGLPEVRAVLWKNGQIRDLGTLGGGSSFSQAINDYGLVTGLALNDVPDPYSYYYLFLYGFQGGTQSRAFLWDDKNRMQDIGTLGGPDAFPSVINQRGQVAGFSYINSIPNETTGLPTFHPFLWEKGKGMKDLGSFGGTQTASVNGLNDQGEVVGGLLLPGDQVNHPFLWDGAKLIDLNAPPFAPTINSEARWINQAGEVVGSGGVDVPCEGLPSQSHSFLWKNGEVTDLGTLDGTPNSQADFVNNRRQIVGGSWSCDVTVANAFLWENGSIVNLNALVGVSQFQLYWAPHIDDRGVIAALGALPDGDKHTVLLIPCDENHPNVEGCDYSMVDANAVISVQPMVRPTSAVMPLPVRALRNNRRRFPGLATFGQGN
jgi:probable HAF family extracellular repeat protein